MMSRLESDRQGKVESRCRSQQKGCKRESVGTENCMEPASSAVGRTASNWAFPDADGCGTEQAGGTQGLSG